MTLRDAFTLWHNQGHAEPKSQVTSYWDVDMFCWGLPSTFVDFFSISKQMTLTCFYFNTLLSLHITVSWNFSHFSDKAEFPWLFPSCLFETLLKPFVLALHFLLADAARPTLLSAQMAVTPLSALGGDGRRSCHPAPAPCDTLPMSHANPAPVICIWPDGTRTFSHQVVSLAAERGCGFSGSSRTEQWDSHHWIGCHGIILSTLPMSAFFCTCHRSNE